MQRIAVIADVHADWPALSSVVSAIEAAPVDRIWCLGDWACGGAHPKRVFDWILANCELVLAGNHEVFVRGRSWERLRAYGRDVAAAEFAFQKLGRRRVDRLHALDSYSLTEHAELVHGALSAPVDGYLSGRREAERNLAMLQRPLLLYAHTHQPALWEPAALPGVLRRRIRLGAEYQLALSADAAGRRLINPGAACDPDGARWLELLVAHDGAGVTAVWHRSTVTGHHGRVSVRATRAPTSGAAVTKRRRPP